MLLFASAFYAIGFAQYLAFFSEEPPVVGAAAILSVVLVGLNVGLEVLAEVSSFGFLVAYALVHVAVMKLRRDGSPAYDPTFTIPDALYPSVPLVGIVATLVVMTQMRPLVIAGGIGLILVGVGWFFVYVSD